jgi:hypothetical protein
MVRSSVRYLLGVLAAIIAATPPFPPARAADGALLAREGDGYVVIWKDVEAHSRGALLLNPKFDFVNDYPKLILPLIACFARSGTHASTTSAGGLLYIDVVVRDGDSAGCRGNIDRDQFIEGGIDAD